MIVSISFVSLVGSNIVRICWPIKKPETKKFIYYSNTLSLRSNDAKLVLLKKNNIRLVSLLYFRDAAAIFRKRVESFHTNLGIILGVQA